MNVSDLSKEELLKFTEVFGFGFYRVTQDGRFVECDQKAQELLGLPEDITGKFITDIYVVPAERKVRIDKLLENKGQPMDSTLSVRVNDENMLLHDLCWWDGSKHDQGNFCGLIARIEDSTIFPKMFDTFPMGLYEIDDQGNLVRVNQTLVKMFGYEDATEMRGKPIKDFYKDPKDLEGYFAEIQDKTYAHRVLELLNKDGRTLELECFTQDINEFEKARWGMVNDVTQRERYIRALDHMPTGYYYIEHAENDPNHEKECLIQCNDSFAELIGFEKKEDAIGINVSKRFHPDKDADRKFFEDLYEADRNGKPIQNYIFKTKRMCDGEIIHIAIDARLVKDSHGKVIGREGTIRDITDEVTLRNKVIEADERLKKTTADINKLIHTFLHPVVKFAGNAELLHQVSSILQETIESGVPPVQGVTKIGKILLAKLTGIKDRLPDIDKNISYDEREELRFDPLVAASIKDMLEESINNLDYAMQFSRSGILVEEAIRNTALKVLETLQKFGYFQKDELRPMVNGDSIELMQGILFDYLVRGVGILVGETAIMRRKVEALRSYIGLKKQRKYAFTKRDVGKLLEENIRRFEPALLEECIRIEYKKSGNLTAEISPNDIDRVICNLLHNVQKYSHKGKSRFVNIRAKELQSKNQVEFSIESFGTPIKKDEIDSGDIWKFGYRGAMAYYSDRDGTGVGLADAKDVVEEHGGTIELISEPMAESDDLPEYKVPYLTTVTIKLPKESKGDSK